MRLALAVLLAVAAPGLAAAGGRSAWRGAPALAAFIQEGDPEAARSIDPDGALRRQIEEETSAAFRTRYARVMTRVELRHAARRNPREFEQRETALDGARALRVRMVFALSFRGGIFASKAILTFGVTSEDEPRLRLELLGSSREALLESWARKQGEFLRSARGVASEVLSRPAAGERR
ncbi:MAG TPA: hypothetical protein VLT61_10940 [Anaeromyxobacteraceae bacterium]|nr:hypothetical protein [Anaeromyxobacteraceae bacterium]